MVFYLLVIRRVPTLIYAQSLAPLKSHLVTGYRGGRIISIRSPAQSGSYIVLHVGLHVGYVKDYIVL